MAFKIYPNDMRLKDLMKKLKDKFNINDHK